MIEAATTKGKFGDGGGLYLRVQEGGSKSWTFRYKLHKVPHEIGLGSVRTKARERDKVGLAEARELATDCRKLLREGLDPREHRPGRAVIAKPVAKNLFKDVAAAYLVKHREGLKTAKQATNWQGSLETYAFPRIGGKDVADVDTGDLKAILDPIWSTKNETAHRVRLRVEQVLQYASVMNMRTGDNPAKWDGNLSMVFAPRSKVAPVKHRAAVPWQRSCPWAWCRSCG